MGAWVAVADKLPGPRAQVLLGVPQVPPTLTGCQPRRHRGLRRPFFPTVGEARSSAFPCVPLRHLGNTSCVLVVHDRSRSLARFRGVEERLEQVELLRDFRRNRPWIDEIHELVQITLSQQHGVAESLGHLPEECFGKCAQLDSLGARLPQQTRCLDIKPSPSRSPGRGRRRRAPESTHPAPRQARLQAARRTAADPTSRHAWRTASEPQV